MTTRRAFLETAAAILASPRSLRSAARLPIGFSTLGCPAWTWKQILDFAQTHDYAGVELRGIQKNMDLTLAPELSREGGRIQDSKRELGERGLRISDLAASAQLHAQDTLKRTTHP